MDNFKEFVKYILGSKLTLLGIAIYLLFNISALLPNHFMDYFFFGSSVHYCCQGLDFYQIPNGAYAFLHGGDLTGNLPIGINSYANGYLVDSNVYHPLTTVLVGTFFLLFSPNTSFHLFIIIKVILNFLILFYLYINFKGNKYLELAFFFFLINFPQYNDIRISQYQFLLNSAFLLVLIILAKHKSGVEGGISYFLTLLIKPVGLIWAPVLLIRKKFKTVIVGLGLFAISTETFNLLGVGKYYTSNLLYQLFHSSFSWSIDYMSLDALLRKTLGLTPDDIKLIKFVSLGGVYFLSFIKKIDLMTLFFLLTVYFLFFYGNIFEYHYSILAPVLAICLLTNKEFQTKLSKILITLISFPTVFFLMRIFNIQLNFQTVYGPNPTTLGWGMVSFFQILPIALLVIYILFMTLKNVKTRYAYN